MKTKIFIITMVGIWLMAGTVYGTPVGPLVANWQTPGGVFDFGDEGTFDNDCGVILLCVDDATFTLHDTLQWGNAPDPPSRLVWLPQTFDTEDQFANVNAGAIMQLEQDLLDHAGINLDLDEGALVAQTTANLNNKGDEFRWIGSFAWLNTGISPAADFPVGGLPNPVSCRIDNYL